ncbi:MAG: hypothetical protein IPK63_00775 [Candidatus Competibacteraceae bacterium]|nr:hypothetical protein [Candidatus Competibacteraceae bacterium]
MKKNLLVGTIALLGSLLAAPAAMAYQHIETTGPARISHWEHHSHRHSSNKIHYLRAKLDNQQAERRRVDWAYNQARRMGDWPTARFEKNRLSRLDREIRNTKRELSRAYEQSRWRNRYNDGWRGEYSYGYDRS